MDGKECVSKYCKAVPR
jgi:hypothetical protein